MFYLIIKDDINAFSRERKLNFLKAEGSINTAIGTQIFKTVVKDNIEFMDLIGHEFSNENL